MKDDWRRKRDTACPVRQMLAGRGSIVKKDGNSTSLIGFREGSDVHAHEHVHVLLQAPVVFKLIVCSL